ncbi:hypothetical protein N7456_007041 [Penicillium angulare]|uniref:DUF7587 domain-containing protein n=1 Tax=Penicillium angulare TaxID=116970 RepID=A0A9W9FIW5_9EURO|nr:hypothetical protein N7456_007041 [Penicillium angulare]
MEERTLFTPNPFQKSQLKCFSAANIPTYLFRVVAPGTAGSTSMSTITSKALSDPECSNHPDDIFRLNPTNAAALIHAHFEWKCGEKCNFISWTSSLLFALHYGLYRHRNDHDKPDLSRILIYILDTSGLSEGTLIKDLDILDAFKRESAGLNDFLHMRRGQDQKRYYFGEYITQGQLEIDGRCASVSLQQMIELGLFELHPGLSDKDRWGSLAKRVLELRRESTSSHTTTPAEIRRAITIAQCCFGDRWVVPLSAMLLALRPRAQDNAKIAAAYSAIFAGESRTFFEDFIPFIDIS